MAGPREINTELIGALPDEGPVVMVNLVRYPSRAAFLDMMASPEYARETYSKLKP